ncbi:SDR family oxidoreductase [Streptomyces sp. DT2A-34]|uniref:SDR family oxidoreductase n=1 Tax=Streptomyces sp. DT2A-34 TaxID=3051182 RepID=UPI00265C5578|nr:SDR family oxidoreductase [Streptomyces sp. DT2A-34]MDO0917531.1 SDR family oxidoreductase [Streptomyces sp. DT2A-34]
MPETLHIITGATGLLGASMILELARDTSDRLLCLARPGRCEPGVRVRQALEQAAHAYDLPQVQIEEAMRRTTALAHDVLDEDGPDLPQPVGHPDSVRVWHLAAHTNLSERARRRCFAANVGGTRRLLALARRWGAQSFSYMSTAQPD